MKKTIMLLAVGLILLLGLNLGADQVVSPRQNDRTPFTEVSLFFTFLSLNEENQDRFLMLLDGYYENIHLSINYLRLSHFLQELENN